MMRVKGRQWPQWRTRRAPLAFIALMLCLVVGVAASGFGAPARGPHLVVAALAAAAKPTATAIPAPTGTATPSATPTSTPPPAPSTEPPISAAAPPELAAQAAYLMDPETGALVLAQHADDELPMASTTKIMTALVALTYGQLDQRITVGADAVAIENGENSVVGLRSGDVLTLRELLYGLMLPSGDDAAVAIADGVAGSQQRFVSLMNIDAFLLGLTHTHYSDVHGLDAPGHFTTARDLAVLTRYTLRLPTFAQIVATPNIILKASESHTVYPLTNTNDLLPGRPEAYPGVLGVKTGHTGNAGYCLVFLAARPQGRLLGVLLGEPSSQLRFDDARALLDWGFASAPSAGGANG